MGVLVWIVPRARCRKLGRVEVVVSCGPPHSVWILVAVSCGPPHPVWILIAELYYDRGNHHEFTSLVKELARPGELTQNTSYDFEFCQVEKPYESYTGANVRLR